MDKRIRRNEICVIGLPRCDYVFSSTRACFIGYGFTESTLEMTILRNLLRDRGIEPIEAAGSLAPGQNVFCAKICSKIIQAQFCIILANNDTRSGGETQNANVVFEYGLMVGFNKYVIPFQRGSQKLPFNISGLDTIKYDDQSFEQKACRAIDEAVAVTTQDAPPTLNPNQILEAFLLSNELLLVPLVNEGERTLYELGRPLSFNLVMSFDGMRYAYFGNFTALRPETVLWRIRTLAEIIVQRFGSLPERLKMGISKPDPQVMAAVEVFLRNLQILLLVTSEGEREIVKQSVAEGPTPWPVEVFSLGDISSALENIG